PEDVDKRRLAFPQLLYDAVVDEPHAPSEGQCAQKRRSQPRDPGGLVVRLLLVHVRLASASARAMPATRRAAPGSPNMRLTRSSSWSIRWRSGLARSSSGSSARATCAGRSAS